MFVLGSAKLGHLFFFILIAGLIMLDPNSCIYIYYICHNFCWFNWVKTRHFGPSIDDHAGHAGGAEPMPGALVQALLASFMGDFCGGISGVPGIFVEESDAGHFQGIFGDNFRGSVESNLRICVQLVLVVHPVTR